MTGFRADADPAVFSDAKIAGAYILDPWYPGISSIWGPSDPPGTFQDDAEMVRNFLPWKRPEGHYPDRDGLYIAVVPTIPSRRRPTDADPPDARREEEREQDVLGDHPGRVAERDRRGSRAAADERWRGDDDDAEPGERGDDLAERVVRRVQPARQRVGERIERDRQGERGDDRRRRSRRPRR